MKRGEVPLESKAELCARDRYQWILPASWNSRGLQGTTLLRSRVKRMIAASGIDLLRKLARSAELLVHMLAHIPIGFFFYSDGVMRVNADALDHLGFTSGKKGKRNAAAIGR